MASACSLTPTTRYPLVGSEDGGGSYTSRWSPCWPVEMIVEVPTLRGLVTVIHGDRLLCDTHQGVVILPCG